MVAHVVLLGGPVSPGSGSRGVFMCRSLFLCEQNVILLLTGPDLDLDLRPLEGVRVLDLTRYGSLWTFSFLLSGSALTLRKCVQSSGRTLYHHDPGRPRRRGDQSGETR